MGIGVKYQPILFIYLSTICFIYISWKQVFFPLFWCVICVDYTNMSFIIMTCTFHRSAGPRRTGANPRVKNALTYIRVLNAFPDSDRRRFFFCNTLLYVDTRYVKINSVAICSRPKLWSTKSLLTRDENIQIAVLRMGIGVKYQPTLFTYLS